MYRVKIADIAELSEEVLKVELASELIPTETISSKIVATITITGQISFDSDKQFMLNSAKSVATWSLLKPSSDDAYKKVTVEFSNTGEISYELPYAFVISYHEHFEDKNGFFMLVVKEVNPECCSDIPITEETPFEEVPLNPNNENSSDSHEKSPSKVTVLNGTLRGEEVQVPNVEMKDIAYTKRSRTEYKALRKEFDNPNNGVRKQFLKKLSKLDNAILQKAGLSDADISSIRDGYVPDGYNVHHLIPLDDGGTNALENLILIKNEHYHFTITNYQNNLTRGLAEGETIMLSWPITKGEMIYIP